MSVLILSALVALRLRMVAFLEWLFGDKNELTLGYWCETCADVHETNSRCLREMVGVCEDCKSWTKLDRFGNCSRGHKASSISKRRLRWERP